jgi:hypothetical protein
LEADNLALSSAIPLASLNGAEFCLHKHHCIILQLTELNSSYFVITVTVRFGTNRSLGSVAPQKSCQKNPKSEVSSVWWDGNTPIFPNSMRNSTLSQVHEPATRTNPNTAYSHESQKEKEKAQGGGKKRRRRGKEKAQEGKEKAQRGKEKAGSVSCFVAGRQARASCSPSARATESEPHDNHDPRTKPLTPKSFFPTFFFPQQ